MNVAADKNKQALKALFGNEALVEKLSLTRIAVVTPNAELAKSATLIAEVLADVLARLWPNIDFDGAAAEQQLQTAIKAAKSGGAPIDGFRRAWSPTYDCVICVDTEVSEESGYKIKVGANDWIVRIGQKAECGESDNPVGPAFAATLAAAQVFQHIFSAELADMDLSQITEYQADLRELFNIPNFACMNLDLQETHLFGVGAVSHGFIWLLEHWPGLIKGNLNLVDQDKYGSSNGQRYAFMEAESINQHKVDVVAKRLSTVHRELKVTPHRKDLNSYCEDSGYDKPLYRAISGLDSAEARRHVAFKLPLKAINMWTEGVRIGAGLYKPEDEGACLACGYKENTNKPVDEVAEIFGQTGLQPDIVRSLLDSGRGLNEAEARTIADPKSLDPQQYIGQPLRSVLPALCATGKITMPNHTETVDVPFAFASLFSGIAGFIMFLKDIASESQKSQEWAQHLFKKPTRLMRAERATQADCVCCNAMAVLIN